MTARSAKYSISQGLIQLNLRAEAFETRAPHTARGRRFLNRRPIASATTGFTALHLWMRRDRPVPLTLVRSGDYDPNALAITVPARHIPLSAIREAATAVYAAAIRTPLIRVDLPPDAATGHSAGATLPPLYLKLEMLQPIGSFKIRGAYNVVRQLTAEQLRGGVAGVGREGGPGYPRGPAGEHQQRGNSGKPDQAHDCASP